MAATTHEISNEAGVNEVTLFRLFESTAQLLEAVVREVVKAESEALDRVDLENFDLRRDMAAIGEVYASTNEKYHAFIRTMISQRTEPKMTEIELQTAVDAFTGMIFASVLRRSICASGYSREILPRTLHRSVPRRGLPSPEARKDPAVRHCKVTTRI
jgi:AcrR family transcriptional regulator